MRRLRILSISTNYPYPAEPIRGVFVRKRLQAIAKDAEVLMVSPVPALDYSHPQRQLLAGWHVPLWRTDELIQVWYPRWLYPPLGTPINSVTLFLHIWPKLAQLHRQNPFDLIDAHFGFPEGVAAALVARRLRLPLIVTLRGHEPVIANHWSHRRALRWALHSAMRVLSVSEELRQFALSLGVPTERTQPIPNGVDTSIFRFRNRDEMRFKFGLSPTARMIASVGSLTPRKGHHRVIGSLAALHRQGIPAELLIVGGETTVAGYGQQLRQLADQLGVSSQVRFTGALPAESVSEIMNSADLLCLASDWEGCPNVVVEALACGTPVIASAVGHNPYLIQQGIDGLMFPQGNDPALTQSLEAGLMQTWDRPAIAARGQRRSWDDVAAEVHRVFQQVAAP